MTQIGPRAAEIDGRGLISGTLATGIALSGLGGCATARVDPAPLAWDPSAIAPIGSETDRVFDRARMLWGAESVVPVRGQIAWLIPQPELTYGGWYRDVQVLPRSDGIVVQAVEGGDMKGYNDTNETPGRAKANAAVLKIMELFGRFRTPLPRTPA